jgi:hypothetical protein
VVFLHVIAVALGTTAASFHTSRVQSVLHALPAGSRWAGLADKDSSDEEDDPAAAKARAAAAAAERQAAVTRQLKEQLTAILLEVTDKMFGEWQAAVRERSMVS